MGAKSRRARKIRQASEFARVAASVDTPKTAPSACSWDLADIVAARNAQMAGQFARPAALADSFSTDHALFVAYTNRLDALASVGVEVVAADGARGAPIAVEADALFGPQGIGITPDTARDFHGCLVHHSVAFAHVIRTPREDGSRVDYAMKAWPIKFVRWDTYRRCYVTQVDGGPEDEIHHGDGRWIVAQMGENDPFTRAALLPAAMIFPRHSFAERDWAKGSVAHGNAKVIGKMPEGVALQQTDEDGVTSLTADARAFVDAMNAIQSGDGTVAVVPAGASVEYLINGSSQYRVWTDLVANEEKAAARVYLGTDGVLGAAGGAPGVDISALFGVATTKIQGDVRAIERAILTGLIEPWCAENFGTSALAPSRKFVLPDADADAAKASLGTRRQAFYADLNAAKSSGALVDQAFVDDLAGQYDVKPFKLKPPAEVAATPTAALPALRRV